MAPTRAGGQGQLDAGPARAAARARSRADRGGDPAVPSLPFSRFPMRVATSGRRLSGRRPAPDPVRGHQDVPCGEPRSGKPIYGGRAGGTRGRTTHRRSGQRRSEWPRSRSGAMRSRTSCFSSAISGNPPRSLRDHTSSPPGRGSKTPARARDQRELAQFCGKCGQQLLRGPASTQQPPTPRAVLDLQPWLPDRHALSTTVHSTGPIRAIRTLEVRNFLTAGTGSGKDPM
jgi:hypothetical protein